MNMFKINPGELRHLIIIQNLTISKDNDGFEVESWQDLFSARAKINNTTGKEFQAGMSENSSVTTKFTIRSSRAYNVTTKNRIVYNDNLYDIKYVNNIFENNIYLEIVAELVM